MSSESSPSASLPAPRRDKFAAMANRASSTTASSPVSAPSADAAWPPGGRRGNKFAAMAANNRAPTATSEEEKSKAEASIREERLRGIKEKLSRRNKILGDLDRAEDLTCKLLEVAHQTTKALEDLSCAPNISALSKVYRETLRELHPLLSTGTEELIQPYQNHSTETRQSMYAARVDMRLAKERTQVLKLVTELERKQLQGESVLIPSESGEKKRRRDE
jgi:hypothetical protein